MTTKDVLERITPTAEDRKKAEKVVSTVITKLNKAIPAGTAVVGGSYAKDTWLKGNNELDIFVQFKEDDGKLSDVVEKVLKKIYPKYIRIHGSRDYFQIPIDEFKVEVIPIKKIKSAEDASNITDVSMLHVGWVKKNIKKLSSDIRLFKQFAQAQKVYGAESHIQGFSGYVLEVLTIHYGGFEKALKEIAKWSSKKAIDINKAHRNVYFSLNKSKLVSPLVLVDPVDDERNAAASVSEEMYKQLISSAKKYVKKPSDDFFVREPLDVSRLEKKYKHVFVITAKPLSGKSDVVGCKLLKVLDSVVSALAPFTVEASGWDWDEKNDAQLWVAVKDDKISDKVEVIGPPTDMKEHAKAFKAKHKVVKVKSGKLTAMVKRPFTSASDCIKHILSEQKDKAKRLSL